MTEDQAPEPQDEAGAEVEWHPVARWPQAAKAIMTDIIQIRDVIELMAGSADDPACVTFLDFLERVLLARRQELAMTMLREHEIEVPEPGEMQTPQQRMSAGLAHLAEEVRKRRPDIHPDKQPATDRARRHLPEMKT